MRALHLAIVIVLLLAFGVAATMPPLKDAPARPPTAKRLDAAIKRIDTLARSVAELKRDRAVLVANENSIERSIATLESDTQAQIGCLEADDGAFLVVWITQSDDGTLTGADAATPNAIPLATFNPACL